MAEVRKQDQQEAHRGPSRSPTMPSTDAKSGFVCLCCVGFHIVDLSFPITQVTPQLTFQVVH